MAMINPEKIRQDFPLFQKRKIIYFDNACTTLKPQQVIDAIVKYYSEYSGCAGRSVHKIANETQTAFEGARAKVAKFIGAKENEIVWTKNTTEAINLLAHSLQFKPGDRVLTTNIEHHSVLLPLQLLAQAGKISLDFALADPQGRLTSEQFQNKITNQTKLVLIHHTSNVFGTSPPLKEIIKIAHEHGALIGLDAAQGVPHYSVDAKGLDVDFLAFSGHKMLGPTGIGCLYGKYNLLEQLSPFMVGGETIVDVKLERTVFAKPPQKFEAGIQHYAGAIGLGAAVDYLAKIGMKNVEAYEKELAKYLLDRLSTIDGIKIYGPQERCALVTFNVKNANPHEIAVILDTAANIAVRSGLFCAQPAFEAVGVPKGGVRASLYIYNTKVEVDVLAEQLEKISKIL